MDIVSATLRLIHIGSGVFWVGAAVMLAGFIAFRDRTAGVTPCHRGLEAIGLRVAPEPDTLRVVPGNAVEHRGHSLTREQAHALDGFVDDHFLHHQHAGRYAADARGEFVDGPVQSIGRHRFADQTPGRRRRTVDQVAGQQLS